MLSFPLSSAVGNTASLGLSHFFLVGRCFLNLGCRHGVCDVGIWWDHPGQELPVFVQSLGRQIIPRNAWILPTSLFLGI